MSKFCQNCGSPLSDGTMFCTECGTPVAAAQGAQPQFVDGGQQYTREQQRFVQQWSGDNTSSVTPVPGATPSPQGEGYQPQFVEQPVFDGRPMQQPYGQQPYVQQPVGNMNAGYAGSPQGEGYPQYQQQPYGQPYGAPQYAPYGAAPAPEKSRKGLVIAIIAIVLVLGLAAVALFVWPGFLTGKGIEGGWINDRAGFALEFKDGKATVRGKGLDDATEFNFTRDGEKLTLEKDGKSVEYVIKIAGDALTLYYEDNGVSFPETYTRDGAEQPEGRDIVGRWGNDNINEFIIDDNTIREIGEDADGEYDISFTYTREGDKLTITEDLNPENTLVRTYEVEDGELTLRDEDGNVTATFNEKGGSELLVASYGDFTGTWLNETGEEIIIGKDTLVGVDGNTYSLEYDDVNFKVYSPNSGYIEEYTYKYTGAELELFNKDTGNHLVTLKRKDGGVRDGDLDLLGKWISVNDPEEYFVFNADGTGVYWDEDFTYVMTAGNAFELKNSYGTYPYTYKISGDILTLYDTKSGEDYDYYRDGTTPPAAEVDEYILGRWIDDYGVELNIYADGSGDYGGGKIKVSTHNGMLYWVDLDKDNTFYYTYELRDGVLIVRDDDTGGISYFKRPGAQVTIDDLVGSWQTDDGYAIVITSDGYLTMMSDGTVYKMEINGDKMRLYIEYSEFDETTRFLLSGDDLKFLEEDGEIISIYHRQKQ